MGAASRITLADIAPIGEELDESRLLGISGGRQEAQAHSWSSAEGGRKEIDD